MDFEIRQDIESVIEITGLTIEELANELNVTRATVSNWLNGRVVVSLKHIEAFHSYIYRKGIRLNRIKEQLYREDVIKDDDVLLFHGAKTMIEGELSLGHNKLVIYI